jgi:hypothetical protein
MQSAWSQDRPLNELHSNSISLNLLRQLYENIASLDVDIVDIANRVANSQVIHTMMVTILKAIMMTTMIYKV